MGLYKRSGVYYVRFKFNQKLYRWSVGTTNKKTAETYFDEIKASIREKTFREKYLDQKPDMLKLTDGASWYLENYIDQHMGEKSRAGVRRILDEFIQVVGDIPIETVRLKNLEDFKTALSKRGLTKPSVDRYLGTISGFFSRLAKYEVVEFNPVAGKFIYFGEHVERERVATVDELRLILGAITDEELRLIVYFAMMTGIRLKDIVSLTMDNIDLNAGFIKFRQSKVDSKAVIPLTDFLTEQLTRFIQARKITGRIFTMENWRVSHVWKALIIALGIRPPIQFRDLRRSFATALRKTADIKMTAELLGHSDLKMAARHYIVDGLDAKKTAMENALKPFEIQ